MPLYVNDRERRRRAVFTHYGPILAGGQLVMASGDGNIRFFSPESGALTGAVESEAATLQEVVQEMLLTTTSERQGRVIDKDAGDASMEKKKQEGYF